jgi:hypothetical protein
VVEPSPRLGVLALAAKAGAAHQGVSTHKPRRRMCVSRLHVVPPPNQQVLTHTHAHTHARTHTCTHAHT